MRTTAKENRDKWLKTKASHRRLWGSIACCLLFSAFLFFGLPLVSFASFERQDAGARPSGLGGAFVAVGGDIHSMFHNPAGLSYLNCKSLSSSYSRLFMGLDDGSDLYNSLVMYGQPVRTWGTLGIGWMETGLSSLYKERTMALGYGRILSPKLAFGVNLKQLHVAVTRPEISYDDNGQAISNADAVFANGNSAGGIGMDLGLLYEPIPRFALGLSVLNVNQPRISISGSDSNRIPSMIKLGFSRRSAASLVASELRTQEFLEGRRDWQWILAGERWRRLSRIMSFAMRGSIGFGSRSFSQLTLGFGGRINGIEMDYGFMIPLSGVSFGGTAGTHRVSLSVKFGKTAPGLVSWEFGEIPEMDVEQVMNLRLELEEVKKRALQAEEVANKMQERIKALEGIRKHEMEIPKKTPAPVTVPAPTQALEKQIEQLKSELERAKERSRKMEQKKEKIEKKIEKKLEKKETPRPVSGKTYVVQHGDTLRSIAEKAWGDASRWIEIYRANEDRVQSGGNVTPGQILVIP